MFPDDNHRASILLPTTPTLAGERRQAARHRHHARDRNTADPPVLMTSDRGNVLVIRLCAKMTASFSIEGQVRRSMNQNAFQAVVEKDDNRATARSSWVASAVNAVNHSPERRGRVLQDDRSIAARATSTPIRPHRRRDATDWRARWLSSGKKKSSVDLMMSDSPTRPELASPSEAGGIGKGARESYHRRVARHRRSAAYHIHHMQQICGIAVANNGGRKPVTGASMIKTRYRARAAWAISGIATRTPSSTPDLSKGIPARAGHHVCEAARAGRSRRWRLAPAATTSPADGRATRSSSARQLTTRNDARVINITANRRGRHDKNRAPRARVVTPAPRSSNRALHRCSPRRS